MSSFGFLSDAKARLQHNNMLSLAPKDIKNLAEIISTEKTVITSSSRLSNDYRKAADALKDWGMGEGDDLADVLPKLAILFGHLADAQGRFSDHDGTYRIHFKSVRMREENLAALKKNRETVQSKIGSLEKKITKMSSENKDLPGLTTRLQEFRSELISLEQSVNSEEARLSDFKRDTVRDGLGLRLGAMLELAEKMTIICELGKMLVAEVPIDRTAPGEVRGPYYGAAKTQSILEEAQRCLTEVIFNPHPGGIISNEPNAPEPLSSPEADRPFSAPHFPTPLMQSEPPVSGFPVSADQAYHNDGNNLPSYQPEPRADQTAYPTFDPNDLSSSSLPYAQEPVPPPKLAYTPSPQLDLDFDASNTFTAAPRSDDPDPIAAAAARFRSPQDDVFYVRGPDGIPSSTGPGNSPTEPRAAPVETSYVPEPESSPTEAAHSHETNPEPLPSPRVPAHRPSNPSISGSTSGWQEPSRTTNAGAFRRGPPSSRTMTYQSEYEPPDSKTPVQPLNVQKRGGKPESSYNNSTPDRSPNISTSNNGLPNPPGSSNNTSAGFSQNRYVTNLDS